MTNGEFPLYIVFQGKVYEHPERKKRYLVGGRDNCDIHIEYEGQPLYFSVFHHNGKNYIKNLSSFRIGTSSVNLNRNQYKRFDSKESLFVAGQELILQESPPSDVQVAVGDALGLPSAPGKKAAALKIVKPPEEEKVSMLDQISLKDEINSLEHRKNILLHEFAEMREKFTSERARLNAELNKAKGDVQEFIDHQRVLAEEQKEQISQDVHDSNNVLSDLESLIRRKEEELIKLQQGCMQTVERNTNSLNQLKSIDKTIEERKYQLENLKKLYVSKEKEIARLQEQIELREVSHNKVDKRLNSKLQELEKASATVKYLEDRSSLLNESIDKAKREVNALTNKTENYDRLISESRKNLAEIESTIAISIDEKVRVQQELKEQEIRKEDLQRDLLASQHSLNSTEEKFHSLTSRVYALQTEESELKIKADRIEHEIEQIEKKKLRVLKEHVDLEKEVEELYKVSEFLRSERDNYRTEISREKGEKIHLQQALKDLGEQIDNRQSVLLKYEADAEEANKKRINLEEQIAFYQREIESFERSKDALVEKQTRVTTELKQFLIQKKYLQVEIAGMKKDVSQYQIKRNELYKELDQRSTELKELEEAIRLAKEEKKEFDAILSKIDDRRNELDGLNKETVLTKDLLTELQSSIERAHKRNEKLRSLIKTQEERFNHLVTNCKARKSERDSLEREVKSLSKNIVDIKSKNDALDRKLKKKEAQDISYTKQIKEKQLSFTEKSEQVSELENERILLLSQKRRLSDEIDFLDAKFKKFQNLVADEQASKERLRKTLKRLTKEHDRNLKAKELKFQEDCQKRKSELKNELNNRRLEVEQRLLSLKEAKQKEIDDLLETEIQTMNKKWGKRLVRLNKEKERFIQNICDSFDEKLKEFNPGSETEVGELRDFVSKVRTGDTTSFSDELKKEIKQHEEPSIFTNIPEHIKKFWKNIAYSIVGVCLLISPFIFIDGFDRMIAEFLNDNLGTQLYLEEIARKREAQYYRPLKTDQYKKTVVDNILKTENYVTVALNPQFQNEYLLTFTDYFVDELVLNEDFVIEILSLETNLIKDIIKLYDGMLHTNKDERLAKMRELETETQVQIRKFLKTDANYEKYMKRWRLLFLDYKDKNGL